MKKILALFTIMFLMQQSKAQFVNTSWTGTFKIPEETQVLLQFKEDSLILGNANTNEILERMKYSITGDTLTITKLDGISPCSFTDPATYKIMLKDEKLYITSVMDDCPERAGAWPEDGMIKKE